MARYRVRLSTEHPAWPLLRQTPGSSGRWGAYDFVLDADARAGEAFDHWVVCEGLLDDSRARVPPDQVVLVTWEPPGDVRPPYRQDYLDQFAHVVTCHRDLRHPSVEHHQQGHPWFVDRDLDALRTGGAPAKSRPLSVVSSSKSHTQGHRQRLELVRAVVQGVPGTDLWGRGFRDFADKWEVLAPYRYSLAVENLVLDDWTTEKLADCLLAETHPFYVGCPNVTRYYPAEALTPLPLDDLDAAVEVVRRTLADPDHYARTLPALREARRRYLEEQQLFPLLAGVLDRHRARRPPGPAVDVTLRREFARPSLLVRARHKLLGR